MTRASAPRLIFWELTKECNLACVHCRAEAGDRRFEGELDTGRILAIIDDIATDFAPILVLTGGEPLYRDDVLAIAAHARDRGLRTALATNGTMITSEIADGIRDAGIGRVSVSLDGSGPASHDAFRGIPGSFEAALGGIARLREAGVEFQVNVTVTRRNVGELDDVLSMAREIGARAVHFFMLVPVGCGVSLSESDMLSAARYEDVLNWLYDRSVTTEMELRATCAPHYHRVIRQRLRREGRKPSFETDGMAAMTRGCLAGSGVCFISHRGDVQPCGYLPVRAGNVLETPFREIWEASPVFRSLRDPDALGGRCGACEYRAVCGGCRARAFHETGDFLSEEPFCAHVPAPARRQ